MLDTYDGDRSVEALLDLVPPDQRATVRVAARRLAARHPPSVGSYPVPAVSVVVAAMAPWLPEERLAALLAYCLWTVELDNRLDVEPPAVPYDGLADVLDGLRPYDKFGLLASLRAALDDAVAARAALIRLGREVARGERRPPAVETYLRLAARDVNYRSVALALLVTLSEVGGPIDLPRLDPALAAACRAVRLANDLVSVDRDRRGGRLNVLGLRWLDGSRATVASVDREIDRCLRAHARQLRDPAQPVCARALSNALAMSVALYRRGLT